MGWRERNGENLDDVLIVSDSRSSSSCFHNTPLRNNENRFREDRNSTMVWKRLWGKYTWSRIADARRKKRDTTNDDGMMITLLPPSQHLQCGILSVALRCSWISKRRDQIKPRFGRDLFLKGCCACLNHRSCLQWLETILRMIFDDFCAAKTVRIVKIGSYGISMWKSLEWCSYSWLTLWSF